MGLGALYAPRKAHLAAEVPFAPTETATVCQSWEQQGLTVTTTQKAAVAVA